MNSRYIGDKAFYRKVLAVAIPIMVQNGITNFVNLLDNIMVGRLSTEAMSGVSIVNQFMFIFNLLIFGAISAAGIFTAQYHGLGDNEGVRYTFRLKMMICSAAGLLGIAAFALFGGQFINLFLHDGSMEGDLTETMAQGSAYLTVMLFGLLPYGVSQAYASTLRETGETVVPMTASIAAVATNFVGNFLLIFGNFGFPKLGVVGAAVATVLSRFVELAILLIWTARHRGDRSRFVVGAYRSLYVPGGLLKQIVIKGLPLMFNEFFWSVAVTMRNQCYSTRGLDVVAAQNISSTITNLFNVVYMALGISVSIIVGNLLGGGKLDEAKDAARKMMAFSIAAAVGMGLLLIVVSPFFPMIYMTTAEVRGLATYMIIVYAVTMPFAAIANSAYFTIRSGGQVMVTILLDSVFMWVIVMPVSLSLAYFTGMSIHLMFALCQATEALKAAFGLLYLKKGNWVRQLVGEAKR